MINKNQNTYLLIWKIIHIVAILSALAIFFLTFFGFRKGFSHMLDIHIPTNEDVYLEYREAEIESDKELGFIIELPDEDGNMRDVGLL